MVALKDMTGAQCGRLLVLRRGESGSGGQARWLCRCVCGGEALVSGHDLRAGHTKSCGCLQAEVTARVARETKTTHGMTRTPIYRIWRGLVGRCTDPIDKQYKEYGGRGITVCDEWLDFKKFHADFGHLRPSRAHSIDRMDNNDGYRLGNVRWATDFEQQNNRRDNYMLTHDGITRTVGEWARDASMSRSALRRRIARGWTMDRALSTPVRQTMKAKP